MGSGPRPLLLVAVRGRLARSDRPRIAFHTCRRGIPRHAPGAI